MDEIPTAEQRKLLLEKLIDNEETHVKVMTVAAAHMFMEIADEFRRYLDVEGFKSKQIKANIVGVRKLRPHIEQIVNRNLQRNITDVFIAGAEGTRSALATSFGLTNDEAVSFASKHTSVLAGEIADNSLKTVQGIISDGIANGRPVKETRKLLEEKFTDWGTARAETVARTETLRAANMGSLEVLRKGGVQYKQWIAASDACGTCLALHQEVYPTGETFMSKGDTLATPDTKQENTYMPMPAPPLHPRCRCTIGGIPAQMVEEYTTEYMDADGISKGLAKLDEFGDVGDFKLAVGEGLQNSFRHGGGSTTFTVRRIGDNLSVHIRDYGEGFIPSPDQWAMPGIEEGATHGRGLAIMQATSDKVAIQKMAEGGNRLLLSKTIPGLENTERILRVSGGTDKGLIETISKQVGYWEGDRGSIGADAVAIWNDPDVMGLAIRQGDDVKAVASMTNAHSAGLSLDFLASMERGYGSKMMKEVAKEAVKINAPAIQLTTTPAARGFYEHLGFESIEGTANVMKWSKEAFTAYAKR